MSTIRGMERLRRSGSRALDAPGGGVPWRHTFPTIPLPATLLFNLLVVVWWLEFGLRVPLFGAIRLEFLLSATLCVYAFARYGAVSASRRRAGIRADNSDVGRAIVLFVVVQALSLPLAADFDIAYKAFIDRVVKYAILGVLISQYVVSPATLSYYLFSTFISFMKIGQEAFVGKVTGSMVWENQGVPRLNGTAGSMFGHPNSLSGKTVSTLPFVWYLAPWVRERWLKILLAIYLVFAVNIIVFTASRTGYLTIIALAFVIAMLSQRRLRVLGLFAGIAVIAVVAVPAEYQGRFLSAFTGDEKEGHSADTRLGLFHDSIAVFQQNPLGVGLSCFPVVQARAQRNAQETHNLYTQLLAETGVQGTICFLVLLWVVLRKAFRLRKRFHTLVGELSSLRARAGPETIPRVDEEIRAHTLLAGTTSAIIVFTIGRLALGVFGHDLLEIYWWLAAGLVMALNNMLVVAEKRKQELDGLLAPAPTDVVPVQGRRVRARSQASTSGSGVSKR